MNVCFIKLKMQRNSKVFLGRFIKKCSWESVSEENKNHPSKYNTVCRNIIHSDYFILYWVLH